MSDAVVIIATVKVKPGYEERVRLAVSKAIDASRAEPGCLSFDVLQDVEQPHYIIFNERWADRQSWLNHMKSPHVIDCTLSAQEGVESISLHELAAIDPYVPEDEESDF